MGEVDVNVADVSASDKLNGFISISKSKAMDLGNSPPLVLSEGVQSLDEGQYIHTSLPLNIADLCIGLESLNTPLANHLPLPNEYIYLYNQNHPLSLFFR